MPRCSETPAQWEYVIYSWIPTLNDVGVIQLKKNSNHFLIFGGKKYRGKACKQTFLFKLNHKSFHHSRMESVTCPKLQLATVNTFSMSQYLRVRDVPESIKKCLDGDEINPHRYKLKSYSENLLIYPGSTDIHIFDLDREQWLICNS